MSKKQLFLLGIFVGCYIAEAVLQSDLRCFQNFDCLQELSDKLNVSVNVSDILLQNSTHYQSNFIYSQYLLLKQLLMKISEKVKTTDKLYLIPRK